MRCFVKLGTLAVALTACDPYRVAHIGSDVNSDDGCAELYACCGEFSTLWIESSEQVFDNDLGVFPTYELEHVADTFDFEKRSLLLVRSGRCDDSTDPWIEVDGVTFVDGEVGVELRLVYVPEGIFVSRTPYVLLDLPINWGGSAVSVQSYFDY